MVKTVHAAAVVAVVLMNPIGTGNGWGSAAQGLGAFTVGRTEINSTIAGKAVVASDVTDGTLTTAAAQLTTSVYASGFAAPVAFVQDPTDRAVQYVVEQSGRVRVVRNGALLPTNYLDLRAAVAFGGEQGLLGLAFAPDYATSGRVFVNFTNPTGNTVVARFRRSADPLAADPSSRFDLRWGGTGGPAFITQPYANHNGGNLAFGPDGFLYIGLGDGGSGDDPEHRAQNPSELLGKMLRIDVNVPDSHATGYQVPTSNPFVAGGPPAVRSEIWSFGLRNPWRYSFDDSSRGGTGALVIGDVGQNRFEEIDYEPAGRGGRNYGWRNREAAHDNVTSLPVAFQPLTEPIHEYDHGTGQSITGGYVYRGGALGSSFQGRYFFADFVAARVWSIAFTIDPVTGDASAANRIEHTAELGPLGNISAFGLDADGELYLVSYSQGAILKVLGTAAAPSITTQPSSQTVSSGQTAQFRVAASGTPVPGYQWQLSTNVGSSWADLTDTAVYGGTATATLTVTSVTAGLSGLQFRCVASSSAGTVTSSVATLTVSRVTASPVGLRFGATKVVGSSALTTVTSAQTVTVSFTGTSSAWTASATQPWVQITNGSGQGGGQFTVGIINPNDVIGANATVSATVTVTAGSDATAVPITLTVIRPGASAAPFGAFDTPVNGTSGIAGSIAVTGWALDDVGVDHVEIWRDLAPGETTPPYRGPGPGNGKIFIATPPFVAGARPDVEAAFATSPLASRAGWGYLLLTWGLWNQGNGTYTLYAFAFDIDGHTTTLGAKTIGVDNVHAAKPFGAIDTPGPGETRSGTFYNFGWALTPGATCVITNGNVLVGIDSGPLVPVAYGDARGDIAAGFPGFTNSGGASGAYLVDTTTLTNGTHQIGWFVTDSCGRQDGIGSRFFTVLNGGATTAPAVPTCTATSSRSDRGDVMWAPVEVRRGGDATLVYPNSSGDHVVPIGQSERVEVQLPAVGGATYAGYQVLSGERRQLPPGSSLDAQGGIFYWQPAVSFLGAYDLEFVPSDGAGPVRVRAVVGTAVRAAIDTPQAGVVSSSFEVAGWAIDEAARSGTGVDTVHVWGYPSTGAAPIFLGVAVYGDARPDIGALFGDEFAHASYSLAVNQLERGTYDLVVYPHSAVTGEFRGARTVRVTVQKAE